MIFHENILEKTEENNFFRQVLATASHSQVVVMSLKPGEDIGVESHDVDQILVFLLGTGKAILNNNKEYKINPGDLFLVPGGTTHNFINTSDHELKLFTIYAPPQHPEYKTDKTKKHD